MSNPIPQIAARKRWVDALRSGNYKQGRYKLRDLRQNSLCAIGLAIKTTDMWGKGLDKLVDTVGISHYERITIVKLNDNKRYSFDQIADYIDTLPIQVRKETSNV